MVGDSGAPMLNASNIGFGMLSAFTGTPAETFYSPLEWIRSVTGKTICTTASC